MNRALFITIGIVTIIVVFLVWLFLFINGAPTNTREVFSDLGILETSERTIEFVDEETTGNRVVLDLNDGEMEQLTTNPVAGYRVSATTSPNVLRFVERGTGYIFEINLQSGFETQVTPNTFPNTIEAYFSPDLNRVILVQETQERTITLIGLPNKNTADSEVTRVALPSEAENIHFIDNDTVTFTRNNFTETLQYRYNLTTNESQLLATLPLPDATVVSLINGSTYAFPKPTQLLSGALYEVVRGSLSPVSPMQRGLTALVTDSAELITYVDNNNLTTSEVITDAIMPIVMLPEKCVAGTISNTTWCASPEGVLNGGFLEGWYKGALNSNDWFWAVSTIEQEAALLARPQSLVGRQVDAYKVSVNADESQLFFINKNDLTLWLLKL